jgi:choline kinase
MVNAQSSQITTAVLLAAGTGSRLQPLTNDAPKCLSEVNGITILERLVRCLRDKGFRRLVVVVGYLDHRVREFLDEWKDELTIEYVINTRYSTTNNLYSLWLAKTRIHEAFLLVESDVVFDASLLEEMLAPDKIAVSTMEPWMNGTTVTVDLFQQVSGFQAGDSGPFGALCHKTVNMYSLSLPSWHRVAERLSQHVTEGKVNEYYETVFAEMIADGSLSLEAVAFDGGRWYEIDTLADLHEAELLFPGKPPERDLTSLAISTP